MPFHYERTASCRHTQARCGRFHTPHGVITTPRFMPVGTAATVKGVSADQLATTGAQMVLANTYHLHLQPGEAVVAEAGGLHRFMGWPGPLLTDSGGYQVFSLGALNRIDDHGVVFRSPRDGARITLTPERSMEIQMALGADVVMAFDQCPAYGASEAEVAVACRRTQDWLERCAAVHTRADQALFGIVQGGLYPLLREQSARAVAAMDLPGIAIGGVSVGEPVEEMHRIVRQVTPLLPEHKPRYLMGIGSLREMAIAVAQGIDLFDCVLPTRLGRHGTALVGGERWNLRNARFRHDHTPLDASCPCLACRTHSRAYLSHLIRSDEMLGRTLLSLHNLTHLIRFTTAMGRAIDEGCFAEDFAPWEPGSAAAHTW
ncbi:tRNA guanosine(34) transglycosylase Tgt [Synechococcus sp. CS-602]|uniref:tRNA guanosine(34) transglycosylase Tgt n=1 Tax=Synechococcaceae TaxID=1890426 RepID=UPI0021A49474|nr:MULTISPECIES: tRNA guanosine(34) transglycosylase Tgt [Synechococcaceae]MCT0203417.1 tRNA guanosine(34) transglycosylase Tgt [Synechococcus sp. CS-603]MCT0204065.1 tRNA guanosine(34) transglycosylase Tgt [Synechococcus sp. CS-602]MCT4364915.1 tRNA guanosine(34) transglycosylase Tgt [Candidatus Regnicoccus frigidus MAG-AL1]MCT4368387.1 tRNA guanosine(34) transglycosylase Tgt [Candidatus Regnicoccus frigidus MAG-AL2]